MADTDLDRIKRNVGRMIDQNAPETDIDAYLGTVGYTSDSFRAAVKPPAGPSAPAAAAPRGILGTVTEDLANLVVPGGAIGTAIKRIAPSTAPIVDTVLPSGWMGTRGLKAAASALDTANSVSPAAMAGTALRRVVPAAGPVLDVLQPGSEQVNRLLFKTAGLPETNLPGAVGAVVDKGVETALSVAPAGGGRSIVPAFGAGAGGEVAGTIPGVQGTPIEPAVRAAGSLIGGGLGAAAQAGVGRVVAPVQSRLTPDQQRLADIAKAEGITLTPGQMTGSAPLKTAESVLGQLPMSAGRQQAVYQQQREQFTAAVLKRAGIEGKSATPEVLQAARDRIGAKFDKLSSETTVKLDTEKFLTDLGKVEYEYGRRLNSMQRPIFQTYLDDILQHADQMPGATYQGTRSTLGTQAKSIAGSDQFLARALKGLQSALDDAANQSVTPANKAAWQEARKHWGNMRTIEKAMSGAGADAAAGTVPPLALRNAVGSGTQQGYARGQGDLNELARVGQQFLRPPPDSGTSQRTFITNLMTGGGTAGTAGLVAATGNPVVGAAIGGALALPPAIQAFINSPAGRAWLASGRRIPGLDQNAMLAIAGQQGANAQAGERRNALMPPGR